MKEGVPWPQRSSICMLLPAPILVGKVVLLSFVVAPILAKSLERELFGTVVGRLFSAYDE